MLEERIHLMAPIRSLVGPVVKASAWRAEDPGFKSRLRKDFCPVKAYQ